MNLEHEALTEKIIGATPLLSTIGSSEAAML
jgi:hypothetical protein